MITPRCPETILGRTDHSHEQMMAKMVEKALKAKKALVQPQVSGK